MSRAFRSPVIALILLCFIPLVLAYPSITINSPENKTYNTNSIDFNVIINDTGSCNLSLDFGATNINMNTLDGLNFTYTNSSMIDGNYNATFFCNDSLNETNSANVSFIVDTIAPAINIISPQNITYNTTNISLNYTITDLNLDKVWYSYNGTIIIISGNTTFTALNNQQSTLTLYANDTAGNTNSTNITFTVDTLGPTINITYPVNQSYYSLTTIAFNITLNENGTCWYSLDAGNTTIVMTSIDNIHFNATNSTTEERNYTVIFYCNDTLGNLNNNSAWFIIDRTNPTISFNNNTDNSSLLTNKGYIQINTTVNDTNLNYTIINIYNNGGGLINTTTYNGTEAYKNYSVTDGTYYYNATVYDKAGHKNSTETRNITIDTTGPNITILSPNSTTYNNSNILLNISVTDLHPGTIWFDWNNTNTTYNGTEVYLNYSKGTHTIKVYSNDSLGNLNSANVTFTVFWNYPPNITLNSPKNNSYTNTNYNIINITVQDPDLDNMTIWLYGDGNLLNISYNKTSGTAFTYNWTSLSEGVHNWTTIVGDGIINTTGGYQYFVTDTTLPSIIITNPVSTTYTVSTILLNITTNDTNPDKIWYNYNGTNVTYNTTINLTFIDGTYTIIAWTNDTAGNLNSTNITFTINTVPPPPSSGSSGSTSSSSGGSDYVYFPTVNDNTSVDSVTFNKYWLGINNGDSTINIDMIGMPIIYLDINFNSNTSASTNLKIIAQTNNPSSANINASIYKYIIINTSINPYINETNLKFKVSRNWITQNNLTIDNITTYSYDNSWTKVNASKYSEDTGFIYYSVANTQLKNFAIGGPIIINQLEAVKTVIEVNKTETIPPTENKTVENISVNLNTNKKGFFEHIGNALVNIKNIIYTGIMGLDKESQKLIVLTISSILMLIIGVVSGVILYRSTLKEGKLRQYRNKKIISGRIMPYAEEPALKQNVEIPPTIAVKVEEAPAEVHTIPDSGFALKKINQLILQCEYALDNGRIEEAKNYYTESRSLYFNSGLDYEQKARVYDKIIELHNKLNK